MDALKENFKWFMELKADGNNAKRIIKGKQGSFYDYIIKIGFENKDENGVILRDNNSNNIININTERKLKSYTEGLECAEVRARYLEFISTGRKEEISKVDKELHQINLNLTLKEKLELLTKLSKQINKEM